MAVSILKVCASGLCFVVMATAAFPRSAASQIGQSPLEQLEDQLRGARIGVEPRNIGRPTPPTIASGPLLEGEISRTAYRLGPGDLLTLATFGFRSEVFNIAVGPEGTIVIPDVGMARVGGLNLEEAERAVARQISRFNRDVEVRLSLAAVRTFKVFLLGNVTDPGMREATAVTRVSELFTAGRASPDAGSAAVALPARNRDGVIHRNVIVRRASGGDLHVDFARFLQLGDLSQNPVLREGDVVHVPSVDQTVIVRGQVTFPATYEFVPSETLAGLLRIANGGGSFRSDAADTIRLLRFSDDSTGTVITVSRDEALGTLGQQILLEPFDAIFVPRIGNFKAPRTATIDGEVERPGTYPIVPEVTTIRDLFEMAGGVSSKAALGEAVLRRQPVPRPRNEGRPLQNIPPEFLSREELRILQVVGNADEQNVVVDFRQMFQEGADVYNVVLQDGDRIHVPPRRLEVTVLGAVPQPGIVPYHPGRSIDYFVELAGGYSSRAQQSAVVVIRAQTGTQLHRRDVQELIPGDRIIIPFKEPRTLVERVQTASTVVNTVASAVVAVFGLYRLWGAIQ